MRPWLFLVSARASAGYGHMRRCLAVAAAMRVRPTFWIDDPASWHSQLDALGISWRGQRPVLTPDALVAATSAGAAGLLLDDYQFDDSHAAALRGISPCARFDDLGSARVGDLIIAPGLGARDPISGADPIVLAGAAYAALDGVFAARRVEAEARHHPSSARRILVGFGGRDSRNLTGHALTALDALGGHVEATVLMGVAAPHLAAVRAQCAKSTRRLVVDASIDEVVELCLTHDLAIGSGGVAFLERLCCGLPSVLVMAAENQRSNVAAAAELGLARVVDDRCDDPTKAITATLRALIDDPAARRAMASAGMALVDGRGAERIAATLESM